MTAVADVATGRVGTGELARLRDVVVRRSGRSVLGPIDWQVAPGERWVVLGANGAGKTTLLQLCAGTVAPSQGAVALFGEALDAPETDLDLLLPQVGWASSALVDQVPRQLPAIDVVLTGLSASLCRRDGDFDATDEAMAGAALARVGCRQLADRPFGSLSEGERKRVQLARALLPEPELLLLDEPAAGLDLGGREALLRLLARLAADPAAPAIVLVTHHVEEIPAGFTHALLLRDGRPVASGPIDAALNCESLSVTFGLPLQLHRGEGRWAARAMLHRAG